MNLKWRFDAEAPNTNCTIVVLGVNVPVTIPVPAG